MILAIDTETTGMVDFKSEVTAQHQPRLVQLGAQLLDDDFKIRHEINAIIMPTGYEIPAEVAKIHGINTEMALKYGVEIGIVLTLLSNLINKADTIIAHNLSFDIAVLKIAFARMGLQYTELKSKNKFCTMQAMTPLCKLSNMYGSYKWPTLQEAHKHCFGSNFDGAHDAMSDVKACVAIYKWIKQNANRT